VAVGSQLQRPAVVMPTWGGTDERGPPPAPDLCRMRIDPPPHERARLSLPCSRTELGGPVDKGRHTLPCNLMQFVAIVNIVEMGGS
jgi:hypothetical protein